MKKPKGAMCSNSCTVKHIYPVGKIAQKTVSRSAFLLIWHSYCQKYTPTDCFFRQFWKPALQTVK